MSKLLFPFQYRENTTLDPSQLQQGCSDHLCTNVPKVSTFRILIVDKFIIFSFSFFFKLEISQPSFYQKWHIVSLGNHLVKILCLEISRVFKCFIRYKSQRAPASKWHTQGPVMYQWMSLGFCSKWKKYAHL